MVSLYERACEIKKATGWTQEQISAETGLHISTVSRIFRVPGYSGLLINLLNSYIKKSLNLLFRLT